MRYKFPVLILLLMATIVSGFKASEPKKRILFFGDSITQQGMQPNGYISLIDSLSRGKSSGTAFELIGAGISGNKVYDLYLRMDSDVVAKKPDLVVIYIGINDVWHKQIAGTGTDYDRFGGFYQAIVRKLQNAGIAVLLCTPTVIGERKDHSNPQDGDLNHYSNWIREYAQKNKLPLVDLRRHFLEHNLENNPENKDKGILTNDRVHLNAAGNQLVASAIWNAIRAIYPD